LRAFPFIFVHKPFLTRHNGNGLVRLHGITKETEAMLRRCWALAILGILAVSFAPVMGQSSAYNKDAVKALAKRIDQHLAKTWKEAKVTPAPRADDYVFFRRLSLDLNGRIPDFTDIGDFIDDDAADKRWKWTERYLDNPEYNKDYIKHFANVWRNIIIGNQTNVQLQFQMPQFEAYLREKMENNVALDKMVLQLLTSQQPPGMGIRQGGLGGGMVAGSPQLFFQVNENKAENLAAATSRVFLGVKIECAQCHAHPFAKWKQDQFWEFAAFYSTTPQIIRRPNQPMPPPMPNFTAGREILIPGTEKVVKAKFLNGKEPTNWDGGPRKVLADWVTDKDNPFFAKAMADHIWSYLMGVSLLEPIMEPSDDIPMTHPDLINDMAKALVENGFDAKFLIRAIVHSDAYQRSSGGKKLADKDDYHLFTRMPMRALTPEQIYDSIVYATTSTLSDTRKQLLQPLNPQQFFNGMQSNNPRQQFLQKFTTQDRRYEPQTSILQALFLMNGEFMAKRTKVANNEDLQTLAQPDYVGGHEARLKSMYHLVLSRPARPEELQRLIPYLERGGATGRLDDAVSDIYWALLNSSEFLHNH
jgi:hypothetical protein